MRRTRATGQIAAAIVSAFAAEVVDNRGATRLLFTGALLLTALLVASCGSGARRPHAVTPTIAPAPHRVIRRASTRGRGPARVVVTVIDGNLWRRIPGARIRLLHRARDTNRRGVTGL